MKRLEVLMGMRTEIITITDEQFKIIQDYGKCLTDNTFNITTNDNQVIPSSQIDDYKILQ